MKIYALAAAEKTNPMKIYALAAAEKTNPIQTQFKRDDRFVCRFDSD